MWGCGQYFDRMVRSFLWTIAAVVIMWTGGFVLIYVLDLVTGFWVMLTG
jgi:hypothetical protein